MEIKNLRYFLAVAREENMTRAAETLHVTQPTLSKALKSLEDELGKKLFTRHSFSIKLTDEGMLLRDRAEDLIAMADKIEQEFISLDDITGGDIYFGLGESYQIALLAREIKKLKDRYPSFTYHITSGDTEQVTEKLDKGILDFGVICEMPNKDKYEFDLLITCHFVRESNFDLTCELCIRTLLDLLHFVPQNFAIEVPSRSIVRKDNLVHYDAAFMCEVMGQTCLFVMELLTGSVCGGGNSRTATCATHDFY